MTFSDAKIYIGNAGAGYDIVGDLQLELLKLNGCVPTSQVLEVGCGCLSAGRKIIPYLETGHYVGIDPNKWLIDVALENMPELKDRGPVFLYNDQFDPSETEREFDFVISHSILSHAAKYQLGQFLRNLKPSLNPNGRIIASLRMCDASAAPGCLETAGETWTYPHPVFFSWDTIQQVSTECGIEADWKPAYRKLFVSKLPDNNHDWFVFTAKSNT